MRKLLTTVNVDGKATKYDIASQFLYRGGIESILGLARYEFLECPDEPAHVVVVKVPYEEGAKTPKPLLDKIEKVFETVSPSGIRPAVLWALNRCEQDIHEAYQEAKREEAAEKAKAKAEADKAKEELERTKAKEKADIARNRKANDAADAAKGNGNGHKPNGNGKPTATAQTTTAKRKQPTEEQIRRKARA